MRETTCYPGEHNGHVMWSVIQLHHNRCHVTKNNLLNGASRREQSEQPSHQCTWYDNNSLTLYTPILRSYLHLIHDDTSKWKHFPRYLPFVREIHWSPVDSPHKSQWRGALMFSLICVWTNGWVHSQEAGDLRRHRAHFDVTVMSCPYVTTCKCDAVIIFSASGGVNFKCVSHILKQIFLFLIHQYKLMCHQTSVWR